MSTIDNIDLIIAVRDLLESELPSKGLNIKVYSVVFPSKDIPKEFFLVKDITQQDKGNAVIPGTVEICIYVKNLDKEEDQSQPNLSRLKALTNIAMPILNDAIKNSTAITSIKPKLVNHPTVGYFYQSLVCETISITNK